MRIKVKELILFGMLGGIISASQIALSFVPNIEIVSLFIILFSLIYTKKALYIVFTFIFIMGIIYGFGFWWFGYLIIWPLMSMVTFTLKKFIEGKYFILSIYSGVFGLLFGLFYSVPYAIFGGLNAGMAYWIAGIQFDIIHCVGNYLIMFFCGKILYEEFCKINYKYIR